MRKALLLTSLMLSVIFTFAQERSVTGVINDPTGEPLPGVTVIVKGTSQGTVTNIDGAYRLMVSGDNPVLQYRLIGYKTVEKTVGTQSTISFDLEEDVEQLEEVVVTALGVERSERSIGYAMQEVSGETLTQSKEQNLVNSLAGQVAGVQVQGTAGNLGGSSRITIRGVNSFLGDNQPLFVVDGQPIDNSNFAASGQDRGFGGGAYDYGNAASDINPEDIESMSVLKGATASALYGARGANGVILITTKSGKRNTGIGLSVSTGVTLENAVNMMEHQQIYGGGSINGDRADGMYDYDGIIGPNYALDGSWGPKYDPNLMVRHWDSFDPNDTQNYGQTRAWVAPNKGYQDFFETGKTFNNSFSLSGGNDKGAFRLGYTNNSSSGIMPNSSLNKNTFTVNANYNLSDKLKASVSASYINQDASGRTATGYDNNNVMQGFTQWWQTQLDFDRLQNYKSVDGSQRTWNIISPTNLSPNYFDNPYWVRFENIQGDTRDRLMGNMTLSYDLAKGLKVVGRASTDRYTHTFYEGRRPGGVDVSSYKEEVRTQSEDNFEGRLMYDNRFGEFSVNGILGGNMMARKYMRTTTETNGGLPLDGFWNVNNSASPATTDTYQREQAINSIFFSGSVGYKDMVFVDASLRNDWFSTLPTDNNSKLYPSVSTSFVFSELPAFQNSEVISFAKVRASYGESAFGAPVYSLYDVYEPLTPAFAGNQRYTVPNTQNNANLLPETTSEYEFGLDMRFFNGRLGVDVAYFNRTTRDQNVSVDVSPTTGYISRYLNAGSMNNNGIELMLTGTPIQTNSGFRWDIAVNYSKINNKVVELAPNLPYIGMGGTWAADLRIKENEPYMSIYGNDYVYNDQGQRVVDSNGFYQFTEDRVFLGSVMPDWTGGIRNTFSFKGVTVSALIDAQMGGKIHSTSLQWAKYSGLLPETAEGGIRENGMVLQGVKEDGSANDIAVSPQVYYGSYWNMAAPNVFDASFVKLREASIGYQLPNKVVSKLPFRDVNFSIVGRNLWLIHSEIPYLDPQAVTTTSNVQGLENAQTPATRSFSFNLSFKL
ncbi:SusC/RagA family TonB-linked outer membrane protein [Flammeovirga sp. SubArs3]|uniref:SusC/RagA family TonB-linked outer membrane protein n=1 Tax=Flammeovirga sp. SubArs3 TaxID=2995316 RepID=UPI00248B89BD|nr:SusC/RagA family TonB-linked outer membrane protein [Flammeovirga sp. SubArs3]